MLVQIRDVQGGITEKEIVTQSELYNLLRNEYTEKVSFNFLNGRLILRPRVVFSDQDGEVHAIQAQLNSVHVPGIMWP